MNDKSNKWTSHTEINAEPIRARINRLKRHNLMLDVAIASMIGTMIPLIIVLIALLTSN